MHIKLQNNEREIKEIGFDSMTESLKQDYKDIFEGVNQISCIQFNLMKIVTEEQHTLVHLRWEDGTSWKQNIKYP